MKTAHHFKYFVQLCLTMTFLLSHCWHTESALAQTDSALRWYKGNLHTHSLWSDGNDFPENIIKWYRDHNYDFLAMTEHNRIAEGERWFALKDILQRSHGKALDRLKENFGDDWAIMRGDAESGTAEVRLRTLEECRATLEQSGEFILIQAEEITDAVAKKPVHMNAVNLEELILPAGGKTVREAIVNNLRAVAQQQQKTGRPMYIHLNHPNFGWGVTADDLAFATDERFFEVYNGHPSIRHQGDESHPSVEKLWDIANTLRLKRYEGQPLYGLGTDDSHHYFGQGDSRNGRGWIYVQSADLTPDSIVQAIQRGDFYASSGVELSELKYDPEHKTMHYAIKTEPGVSYKVELVATPKSIALPPVQPQNEATSEAKNGVKSEGDSLPKYSDEIGKIVATSNDTVGSFQCDPQWLYARIVITSDKEPNDPSFKGQTQQAWLQPFGY